MLDALLLGGSVFQNERLLVRNFVIKVFTLYRFTKLQFLDVKYFLHLGIYAKKALTIIP